MTGARVLAGGEVGTIYRRLGVEPIINGRSTFTTLGGSLMAPDVLDAIREAAACFMDLTELQEAVGRRLAELTHNEAAFVSGGAAAGLFLSAAVCMTRDTEDGILRLEDVPRIPREFIIHRAHRIPYDLAIELAGGRLRQIGTAQATEERELVEAIGNDTAAILYVPKAYLAPAVLCSPTMRSGSMSRRRRSGQGRSVSLRRSSTSCLMTRSDGWMAQSATGRRR